MTLNAEKVYSKFRDIAESIERLRAFRKVSSNDFLSERDQQDIASFRLIVATEASIDLCLHVAAKKLNRVPDEYAGCFKILGDAGIIDKKLSDRLSKMARFRNLLVHQYWQIDYSRLYEIITGSDLEDLEAFIRKVGNLVEDNQ